MKIKTGGTKERSPPKLTEYNFPKWRAASVIDLFHRKLSAFSSYMFNFFPFFSAVMFTLSKSK